MLFSKKFKKEKVKVNDIKINCRHGGNGPALLLIHGYPQTHIMWHKVVKKLSKSYYVICPDLRGYGKSSKPKGLSNHENYSKKTMAKDMIELIDYLGFDKFYIAGHDRGARVAHRLCLDFESRVLKACFMDIVPTYHMFKNTNQLFATGYYHWFFLIQPNNLPEKLISKNPTYYLKEKLKRWSANDVKFDKKFDKDAVNEYIKCFDKATIHGSCEDYRAAASIDLVHDLEDKKRKINMPILVLWGKKGFINKTYNVINVWQEYANSVNGKTLDCGHFLPEEKPKDVIKELKEFF
ncbi:MAG: alpha/beta fold hydrolase [Campylobacterota bacterium]